MAEAIGTLTAICQRHPDTGKFTVSISLGFRDHKRIDCPTCGRGYVKLEMEDQLLLYSDEKAKLGVWFSDRPLTVIREVLF